MFFYILYISLCEVFSRLLAVAMVSDLVVNPCSCGHWNALQ